MNTEFEALYLGAELRIASAPRLDKDLWFTILRSLNEACTPSELESLIVDSGDGLSRRRSARSEKAITQLLSDGSIRRLLLQPKGMTMSMSVTALAEYADAVIRARAIDGQTVIPAVSVLVKLSASRSNANHFVQSIKALFELLHAESGHLHCSHEYGYVLSETSNLYSSPAWPRYPHEDVGGRVEAVAPFRARHDARVYGAYWGTLLNAKLAATLGGAEAARRATSIAVADTLPNGGVYLQVSPSPLPATGERVTEYLKQLESFLLPVCIPIRQFFQE